MNRFLVLLMFSIILLKGSIMKASDDEPIVGLNHTEKTYLLSLVRTTITHYLETQSLPPTQPVSDKLKDKFGVFVTLHKHGQLRGCIGYIEGLAPLYQAVMEMAKSAAFNDPRFNPVTMKEVPELEIEISVLSPLKKVKDVQEIQVGKHGIIIQQGFHRGLLLPQVATEWGWNREEFLEQTCYKAGLPKDSWKDASSEIFIFSAEIFSEKNVK